MGSLEWVLTFSEIFLPLSIEGYCHDILYQNNKAQKYVSRFFDFCRKILIFLKKVQKNFFEVFSIAFKSLISSMDFDLQYCWLCPVPSPPLPNFSLGFFHSYLCRLISYLDEAQVSWHCFWSCVCKCPIKCYCWFFRWYTWSCSIIQLTNTSTCITTTKLSMISLSWLTLPGKRFSYEIYANNLVYTENFYKSVSSTAVLTTFFNNM